MSLTTSKLRGRDFEGEIARIPLECKDAHSGLDALAHGGVCACSKIIGIVFDIPIARSESRLKTGPLARSSIEEDLRSMSLRIEGADPLES